MVKDLSSLETAPLREPVEALARNIAEQVHRWSARHETLRCWLLLDPARSDAREEFAAIDSGAVESAVKVPLQYTRFPRRLWPVLVPVDLARNASATLFERAIQMAVEDMQPFRLARKNGIRIPAWAWTTQPGLEIARHIAAQSRQIRGADARFLRFFDPLVMDPLWSGLSADQRCALISPFAEWQYVGRNGEWCRRASDQSAPTPDLESTESRLRLSAEQWSICDAIDAMNVAIAEAGATRAIDVTTGRLAQLLRALGAAQARGLTGHDDLAGLCRMLLRIGLHFPDHSEMQPVWAAVARGESWEDAMGKLEANAWERVMAASAA